MGVDIRRRRPSNSGSTWNARTNPHEKSHQARNKHQPHLAQPLQASGREACLSTAVEKHNGWRDPPSNRNAGAQVPCLGLMAIHHKVALY
ncbi:conserved hypothetical protein [Ricinus communis]|uniref:Uncharacterized protein n=1 Tax=Ricinus communis TaxID=3988 RepID=B9RHP6_RICCO|nr:conserved hypothetical protein [Ricinus communis]EEF49135.1 conserved hypothetical protein [Ricinus communis]